MKILNLGVLKAWQNWLFVALVIAAVTYGGFLLKQAKSAKSAE